jgi:hypothetical protein
VILPDVNVLIHAVNADSPRNARIHGWWDACLSGSAPVGLAWAVTLGFVRITTNHRVMENPLSLEQAADYVRSWLAQPCVRTVVPREGHWDLVESLLRAAGTAGNLTTDAHLAALAMQQGYTLYTTDTDFSRFPGLKWSLP